MKDIPRLYLSAAFIGGILLTLGFKDFYPDLERRFRRRRGAINTVKGAGLEPGDGVELEDRTKANVNSNDTPPIPEGIAGCIGNTALFKIRSLSEETGCEILAKAEVRALSLLEPAGD